MPDIDIDALLDDPRAKVGAAAIDGEPAGRDIRDEPEFDQLDSEFRKMETDGPTAVDWKMLNSKTLEIIEGKSKDLVLASRLTYGLYREERYAGLAVGLSILDGMVGEYWDGMFPPVKRERGRAGAFDWVAEKLAPMIEEQPPANGDLNFALVAHDRLVDLDDKLTEKLQRFPAALGPLIRALRPHARDARAAIEAAAAEPEVADPEPQAAADAAPTGSSGGTKSGRTSSRSARSCAACPGATSTRASQPRPPHRRLPRRRLPASLWMKASTRPFSRYSATPARSPRRLRRSVASDPRAYLLSRLANWGDITALPPANAGKTALPPPQPQKLAELEAMRGAGNMDGLLMSAEGAFVSSPFWIDAQHTIVQTMKALGTQYDAARGVVEGQLAAFLGRLPELAELSFNDGTPFANGETRGWIADEIASSGGGGASDNSELLAVSGEAGQLGQAKQVLAGLQLLSEFADSRPSGRDRFLATLEIGEFCLRFGLLEPLFPLIEKLREIAATRGLDAWEPQLMVSLAGLAWRAFSEQSATRFFNEGRILEEKARVMASLSELDIVAAAKLSSTKPT